VTPARTRRRRAAVARVAVVVAAAAPCALAPSVASAAAQRPTAGDDGHGRRPPPARPAPAAPEADASMRMDLRRPGGRGVPSHFVGLSIEWSLVERYMGPGPRRAFASLLRNLGSGLLRIGGNTQDLMPFDANAANANRIITPEDLLAIRATLAAAKARSAPGEDPSWGAILGTGMAPREPERPWVGTEHARSFATRGVAPVFAGRGARYVAGITLGNEPDLSFRFDLPAYLFHLAAYRDAAVTRPYAVVAPSTSEPIAPWKAIEARSAVTRFFWAWPAILDAIAPAARASRGPHGALATDHFYPLARNCDADGYRCATIERLLSAERLENLAYAVHAHATEAARRGLRYRLSELGSAAGRGVEGVSNVAASATWALAAMFEAACPQPPQAPGANAGCALGAHGVNFHNAEVREFFLPEEGNAFYNPIVYDAAAAPGAPAAAPVYYAMLLFAHFAQETRGLRPVAIVPERAADAGELLSAWQLEAGDRQAPERRLFVVNRSPSALTATIAGPRSRYLIDRMTPFDPTGGGRLLDAPQVRIDGRAVSSDGRWPGFAPTSGRAVRGRLRLALGPGEVAVVSFAPRPLAGRDAGRGR
jgi:hypothetical protein